MKCPRCGYHNLPGAEGCGQCGSQPAASAVAASNGAAVAAEEFYPPRARERRMADEVAERLRGPARRARALAAALPAVSTESYWLPSLLGIIPGLVQWRDDRRRLAVILAASCVLALALGVLCIRWPASNALLALAGGILWYSAWDAARCRFPPAETERARPLRDFRLALLSASILFSLLAGFWL